MSKLRSLLLLSILLAGCTMPGATPLAVPASAATGAAQPLPSPVGEYQPVRQANGTFRFEPISAASGPACSTRMRR